MLMLILENIITLSENIKKSKRTFMTYSFSFKLSIICNLLFSVLIDVEKINFSLFLSYFMNIFYF